MLRSNAPRSCLGLRAAPRDNTRSRVPVLPRHDGARRTFRPVGVRAAKTELGRAELDRLWQDHIATEFIEKSADNAIATMVPHAYVNGVPVLTGGTGTVALRQFYAEHFIPHIPPSVVITPVSRSVGTNNQGAGSLTDEFIMEFDHTEPMEWMLPGVAPTGRHVRVPFVVVVEFEGDKLSAERLYWDQATVLQQLGLLPPVGPHTTCVSGAEQAAKALDQGAVPSNLLIRKAQ